MAKAQSGISVGDLLKPTAGFFVSETKAEHMVVVSLSTMKVGNSFGSVELADVICLPSGIRRRVSVRQLLETTDKIREP